MRARVVTIRHDPTDTDSPLVVYLDGDRLGEARPLLPIANDRPSTRARPAGSVRTVPAGEVPDLQLHTSDTQVVPTTNPPQPSA